MTREELERAKEEGCPKYKLLQDLITLCGSAIDLSHGALIISIIAIVLSAISIGLRFV